MYDNLNEILIITGTLTGLVLIYCFYPNKIVDEQLTTQFHRLSLVKDLSSIKNPQLLPLPPVSDFELSFFKSLYPDSKSIELLNKLSSELNAIQNYDETIIFNSIKQTREWENFVNHALTLPVPDAVKELGQSQPEFVALVRQKSNLTTKDLVTNFLAENQFAILSSVTAITLSAIIVHIIIKYVYKTTYKAIYYSITAKIAGKLAAIKKLLMNLKFF